MRVGVQFTGSVAAGRTHRWYTWGWPAHWHVVWYVVPTSPRRGAPQIEWDVEDAGPPTGVEEEGEDSEAGIV